MFRKRFFLLTVLVLMALAGVAVFAVTAETQESCVSGKCHPTMLKAKNIHPIAQSCDSCHQAAVTPHPQTGKKTFKLLQEGAELCKMCHPAIGTKKNVHDPVKNGMCTSCHSPHEADEAKLLLQPRDQLCVMCHSDKTNFKVMHGPTAVGDCTACHSPHDSDNKALALKEGSDLCFVCHGTVQDEMKKKVVHTAVLAGCTSCHNPHGSPFKKLLSAEGASLCLQCHPQIGEKVDKSKSVHAPIKTEKGCAACHAPHASDGEKLVAKTGKDFCLGCHKDIVKKNQTVLHGPIKEGKCAPCHDPHGSQFTKLLVKGLPADLYVPYTENEFALCFSCHNRDLLRFPDTSFATGFRDGEKNLHFLHVNKKDKGRNCKVCHNMHASELPRLIPDRVVFGKWDLPLKFVKWETGGSCAPGCHKKFVYDRKTPGKEPEPAKPEAPTKPKGK